LTGSNRLFIIGEKEIEVRYYEEKLVMSRKKLGFILSLNTTIALKAINELMINETI